MAVKSTTLERLQNLLHALKDQLPGQCILPEDYREALKEFRLGSSYVEHMISTRTIVLKPFIMNDMGGINGYVLNPALCPLDNLQIERMATTIALQVGEKVKSHQNRTPTPPENLIPFDEAVKFSSDGASLALMYGIPADKIPSFIMDVSELFKTYLKIKS